MMDKDISVVPRMFVALCVLLGGGATYAQKSQVVFPPQITLHPPVEKPFKLTERLELPCRADGVPEPTYSWEKDGHPLVITGLDMKQMPGEGTLVIDDPKMNHEGTYQCRASNPLGVAVTVKTVLKKAVLEPFPTIKEAFIHHPTIGSPLTLTCTPPLSYPTGSVYWGENKNQSKLKPIDNNERIALDYRGNLHFANVRPEDANDNARYLCVLSNSPLRTLVQGEDQRIEPEPVTGPAKYEAPRLMWSSPTLDIAVKGQSKRMKCIFSGYPTPKVTWSRLDAHMPSKVETNASTSTQNVAPQEMYIPDVDNMDAGRYQCSATNAQGKEPVRREFTLTVESPPFWRSNRPPEDVSTSEEENANFDCHVNGVPKPTITWFINGIPVEDSPQNSRRTIGSGWLRYDNVTKSDAQVVQCNASNAHGYIFANAYLNVVAEAPSFKETPQAELKVAEGQTALLKCRVFGAPKPVLVWQKGVQLIDVIDIDPDHYDVLDNGDLEISNARREDQDMYQCYVSNKFGTDSATGSLIVTERTKIVDPPKSQVVTSATDVTFRCNATTDSGEIANLKIEWKKNGQSVVTSDKRTSITDRGNLLTIRGVTVEDSGSYTCHASNGLDSDTVTAVLTVKDRPKPPRDVRIVSSTCAREFVDVTWTVSDDNNDQVTGYTVYYNTSHDDPGRFHEGSKVNSTRTSARITLRPWANYTFHVTAENAVGVSERSDFTDAPCSTAQEAPYRNPHRVCAESRDPHTLVVIWEPMLKTEHNGEGFHYLVRYKRRDVTGAEELQRKEFDWRQSELRVEGQETYKQFQFTVQAVNKIGSAPGEPEWMIGYSGEDVPLVIPKNFELDENTLNSTSARFRWDKVDANPDLIRGFFRGYQIHFWKTEDPSNRRTEDVIVDETWRPCSPLHGGKRRRRRSGSMGGGGEGSSVQRATFKLWPFSKITAGVVVINGGKMGSMSNTISFETPEGVPSVIPAFWVSERGSHHLRLSWTAPFEINGILRGYVLSYKKALPALDFWRETFLYDPLQTYKKIHNLDSDTMYLLSLWAITGAGRGRDMSIEESTVSEQVPDKPVIDSLDSDYDSVNVSWSVSTRQPAESPAREFVVGYRLRDVGGDWTETEPPEMEHNWINVTDLEHKKTYEFYVRGMNRRGDSMKSDVRIVTIGMKSEPVVYNVASTSWFIPLLCICIIILLLLLILLIIILIRRNRGGKYPVYEKERLHGHKGKLDEEPTFGEYVRTEDSTVKKSQGSLESSSKSEEENSDSLGIYEDVDPTKFNDEGSFVDQMGYKRPLMSTTATEYKAATDVNSPSAFTTFV